MCMHVCHCGVCAFMCVCVRSCACVCMCVTGVVCIRVAVCMHACTGVCCVCVYACVAVVCVYVCACHYGVCMCAFMLPWCVYVRVLQRYLLWLKGSVVGPPGCCRPWGPGGCVSHVTIYHTTPLHHTLFLKFPPEGKQQVRIIPYQ